jgi:hypothetical protein
MRNYRFATGIGSEDRAVIQSLYGARSPDAFDAVRSNNTASNASAIPTDPAFPGRLTAKGDLTTHADVDFYKFTVPLLGGLTGISVRLTAAGQTLLTPDVTVYNSSGRVVASGRSLDPTNNDISLRFASSLFGGTFTIKVDGATPDFGIGGYQLTVDFLSVGSLLAPVTNLLAPVLDAGTNDSLSTATLLSPRTRPTPDARFDYGFRGVIESASDVDNYRITAQPGSNDLNVIVWGLEVDALDPTVRVFDSAGRPVGYQVLANDRGVFSLQVPGTVAGQDYILQIAARTPGDTGSYYLGADFHSNGLTEFETLATREASADSTTDTLVITQAGLFEFALAAAAGKGGVRIALFDSTGTEIFGFSTSAGDPAATRITYLRAGTYSVRYTAIGETPVRYRSQLLTLTDPVGPYASSTTSTAPTEPQPTSTSTSSTSTTSPDPTPTTTSSSSETPTTTSNPPSNTSYTYSSSSTSTSSGSWYTF